jgi:hypothetical protein
LTTRRSLAGTTRRHADAQRPSCECSVPRDCGDIISLAFDAGGISDGRIARSHLFFPPSIQRKHHSKDERYNNYARLIELYGRYKQTTITYLVPDWSYSPGQPEPRPPNAVGISIRDARNATPPIPC